MHTSRLILFALGAVALAFPTQNMTDISLIEKRSAKPWIDSYPEEDGSCSVGEGASDGGYRPYIQAGDCVPFSPYKPRVGGSWGTQSFAITSFWAFENDDCTGTVKAKISRKGDEYGFCFALDTLGCQDGSEDNPCYWNSVMAIGRCSGKMCIVPI